MPPWLAQATHKYRFEFMFFRWKTCACEHSHTRTCCNTRKIYGIDQHRLRRRVTPTSMPDLQISFAVVQLMHGKKNNAR